MEQRGRSALDPGDAPFAAAEARALDRHGVRLIPGELAPLLVLDLPPGLTGAAREQVARRSVADMLGIDSDRLRVRAYRVPEDRAPWQSVLAIDAKTLEAETLSAGAGCRALLPDYLGLPVAQGTWVFAADPPTPDTAPRLRARFGPADGMSGPPSVLARVLRDKAGQAAPAAVVWTTPPLPEIETALAEVGLNATREAGALVHLAHGELDHDLRRDPRAARAALRRLLFAWAGPVIALLIAAMLWSAAQLFAIRAMDTETTALRTEMQALVRRDFVPDAPLLDLRVQVLRALEDRRTAPSEQAEIGARDILARAVPALDNGALRLVEVLGQPSGLVDLTLWAADFDALDQLVLRLEASDLAVTLRDARLAAPDETPPDETPTGRAGVLAQLQLAGGG